MYRRRPLFTKPQLRTEPPKKSAWKKLGETLWKALKKTCMAVGVIVILWSVFASIFLATVKTKTAVVPLPDEMVLYYRIDQGIVEKPVRPTLTDPFPSRVLTMPQLVRTLSTAKSDDRVKGIVVSLHGAPLGMAQIQELRHSLKSIKQAGKFAYVVAPSYGAGGGIGEYYLASVFDRIWMHPVGIVSAPGISMETPYVKSVLDKLGITPQFFQRKEFKSAFENFTAKKMSKSNRQAMQSVVDNLGDQIVSGISQGRGLEEKQVKEIMRDVLIPAPSALERKLVDALGYGDDVIEYIETTHNLVDLEIVNLSKYSARKMSKRRGIEDVAYIHIDGTLTLAPDPYGNDYGDVEVLKSGSDIAAAINAATDDDRISAIIIRVDSPGGTPAAAEVIRHALVNAKKNGKKVYVSMANVAASGGYWLSADADQIFALPSTLTGSIGVVGGKVTIQEMAKKLGVRIESVRYGKNSNFWSMTSPFNAEQIKQFEAMLDVTYENFISLVANGRGMTFEEAEERAKGRVWTGTQALDRDLIDGLGGLGVTLDILAKDLGHKDQNDLSLVQFPRPKPRYEEVLEFLENQAVFMGVMAKLAPMLESFSVYLDMPQTGSVNSGLSGV